MSMCGDLILIRLFLKLYFLKWKKNKEKWCKQRWFIPFRWRLWPKHHKINILTHTVIFKLNRNDNITPISEKCLFSKSISLRHKKVIHELYVLLGHSWHISGNRTSQFSYTVEPVQSDTPRDQGNGWGCIGCRNTQVLFQLTEILFNHKLLSDVTVCHKTHVSDWTSYTVTTHSSVRCTLKFAPYMLQYIIIIVKIHIKQYSIYILGMCWVK